jgi:hypothetical protein
MKSKLLTLLRRRGISLPFVPMMSEVVVGYGKPEVAFSLRDLGWGNSRSIDVRRTSDNLERSIYWRNGLLDTQEIVSFCGTSPGVVPLWISNASNGGAKQISAADQPLIYDGTSISMSGIRPSIDVSGLKWMTSTFSKSKMFGAAVTFVVMELPANLTTISDMVHVVPTASTQGVRVGRYRNGKIEHVFFVGGTAQLPGTAVTLPQHVLVSSLVAPGRQILRINGVEVASSTHATVDGITQMDEFYLGNQSTGSRAFDFGKVQEVQAWDDEAVWDNLLNEIETNTMTFYGIE